MDISKFKVGDEVESDGHWSSDIRYGDRGTVTEISNSVFLKVDWHRSGVTDYIHYANVKLLSSVKPIPPPSGPRLAASSGGTQANPNYLSIGSIEKQTNDGRDTCYACGAPTKSIGCMPGSKMRICSKCKK